MTLLTDLKLWH